MAQDKKAQQIPLWGQILCGVITAIILICVIAGLNGNKKGQNTPTMTISEAQTKCMLMEEADMVNYMGEPFGDATTKKAEEFCLSQWDRSENPENTDEKFIEIVESDWEQRKDEVLEGYTLQQLYDESKGI